MTHRIEPLHSISYDGAKLDIYHAEPGQGLPRHSHAYAHLTMCHAGSCAIRKEGKQVIINKNSKPVNLLADGWHEIEALESGTVFVNVFAEGKY